MEDNLIDLDILDHMIRMIFKNSCTQGGTNDEVFLSNCRDLKAHAEIYTALYQEKAVGYLKDRKMMVYTMITSIANKMADMDVGQMKRLEFVERELLRLYAFYMELYYELIDKK